MCFGWHINCANSRVEMLPLADLRWYVLYCTTKKEEYAKLHLRARGLEVFFPKLLLPGPSRKRVVPLFPNYLFARLSLSESYYRVVWSPGVKRFVSFGDAPAPLEAGVVTFLMRQATSDEIIKARWTLKVGEQVQISGGSFDGLVGIIQEPPNAKERVKVLLKLLNREVKVELPLRFIETNWVIEEPLTRSKDIGSNLPRIDS